MADVVVKDRVTRNRLLEFLVDKRSRSLDYLRILHSTGDTLWMNSVRITLEDLDAYFDQEGEGVNTLNDPVPSVTTFFNGSVPHATADSGKGLGSSGGGGGSSGFRRGGSSGGTSAPGVKADDGWVSQHLKEWLVLGMSLGALVQLPLAGLQLLDAVNNFLLEFEYFFAGGTAGRALAYRALKRDREDVGMKSTESVQSIQSLNGFVYLRSFTLGLGSGIPVGGAGAALPTPPVSYRTIVPPLCSTLQFLYRKLCDYDITEEQTSFQKLLTIDRKLKHIFFGAISKELSRLGEVKLKQQRTWMLETVFAPFSAFDNAGFSVSMPDFAEATSSGGPAGSPAGGKSATVPKSSLGDSFAGASGSCSERVAGLANQGAVLAPTGSGGTRILEPRDTSSNPGAGAGSGTGSVAGRDSVDYYYDEED